MKTGTRPIDNNITIYVLYYNIVKCTSLSLFCLNTYEEYFVKRRFLPAAMLCSEVHAHKLNFKALISENVGT